MNCISPPEPEDRLLIAYLDGVADQALELHLQQCLHCRKRAEALAREQNRLITRLFRVTCPPTEELGEYHLRMLPAAQMLVVAQHVRECPRCAREIFYLEEFMSELAPRAGLLKPVEILLARLVKKQGVDQDSASMLGPPAFASLRGEGEDEPFIYQAGNVRIVIEVQEDIEQAGFKTLLGLVTGLASSEFTIQVSQGDQVIATDSIDEVGNFIIPHLYPGHYKLILAGPNVEIHIQSLPVL